MALDPQYCASPIFAAVAVTAANTSSQGGGTIGTDIFLLRTIGTNGDWIDAIRFMPTASAAATSTTATVARIFVSTQSSGATTSANTHLIAEVLLPSVTADSSSANTYPIDVPISEAIQTGNNILITNHAAPAANTQWKASLYRSGTY
jgi:hypothetical protein